MAHSLYTPTQAARSTIAALRYLSVLPRTVRQDFSQEFVAGRGRTVDIKIDPVSAGTARTYTDANRSARDAIVFDDLTETTVPVTMDSQVYKAIRLPDDFATFTLESLEQEVLRPQADLGRGRHRRPRSSPSSTASPRRRRPAPTRCRRCSLTGRTRWRS